MSSALHALFAAAPRPDDALSTWRQRSWQKFCRCDLPNKKSAAYKDFPWQQFYAACTQRPVGGCQSPLPATSALLLANDQLIAGQQQAAEILSLQQAARPFSHFLHRRLQASIAQEEDPLALLNITFCRDGLFLYLPPGQRLSLPIVHLLSKATAPLLFLRLQIAVGQGAQLELTFGEQIAQAFPYHRLFDISLAAAATLTISHQLSSSSSFSFDALRANLDSNSSLTITTINPGKRAATTDFAIALQGEGARCQLQGLSLLDQQRQAHVHTAVRHAAASAQSQQHFRHLLRGDSKASFAGKIYVAAHAQQTRAYQLNKNLLLSDTASANSQPSLEILADDVTASHGATTAQIDPQQLFYLQTRGIPRQQAQALLAAAFCRPIDLPDPQLATTVRQFLNPPSPCAPLGT